MSTVAYLNSNTVCIPVVYHHLAAVHYCQYDLKYQACLESVDVEVVVQFPFLWVVEDTCETYPCGLGE